MTVRKSRGARINRYSVCGLIRLTGLSRYAPTMRRYSVREAPRAILQHELADHIRGEEHLHPEQPERAEALQRALQFLEMGSPHARVFETEYRVNEDLSRRYGVTEGTRAEILAELDQYAADRAKQGKEEKARRYAKAIALIGKGADEIEVDRIVYRVFEDGDLGEPERDPDQASIDIERDARVTAAQDAVED